MQRGLQVLSLLAALGLAACSSKKECAPRVVTTTEACATTQDCVDLGYVGLSCVNRVCARPCTADADCVLPPAAGAGCGTTTSTATFVCESELCAPACPDVPCASGETCVKGRCAIFYEGFELAPGQDEVTLKNHGWNDLAAPAGQTRLENRRTTIAFSGYEGCSLGDERCAGPAAEGVRFAALERQPTPERSTPATDVTCRSCACCLECRLNPPVRTSTLTEIPACPGALGAPVELVCAAEVPSVCASVCSDCEACPAAPARTVGDGLLTCEADVAPKGCAGCNAYAQCVADALAAHDCRSSSEPCAREADCRACVVRACDALKDGCFACRDAAACELATPGSSACRTLRATCDAQGEQGCYTTPIDRPRSQLTDEEQALVSPPVASLAGASGRVVLELQYVPFDIREKYRRVIQGQPPAAWPIEDQEVVVQLCPGHCEMPSSWVDGLQPNGQRASFPPLTQRRNGLTFGGQSTIDWRSNRLEVDVPAELRTADFRFRFLPRLDDDARVGLDDVKIRRR